MIDEREWDPITGRSNTWRTIIRDGHARKTFFFTRMISFTELRDWLLQPASVPSTYSRAMAARSPVYPDE